MIDRTNITADEEYWDALRQRGVSLPPVHLDFTHIPWKEFLHPRGGHGKFRDKPHMALPQRARLVNPVGHNDRGSWAPGMTLTDAFHRVGTKMPERALPKIDYTGIEPKLAGKIKDAKTIEDLSLAMGEHYPQTDFDFDGFDVETMREVTAQYSRLTKEFPEVGKSIVYLGSGQHPENTAHYESWLGEDSTWAYAGKSALGNTLMLHPYFFGAEYADLQSSLDENVRSGWHPEGANTPSSILTHEFGHHVDWWIEKKSAAWGGKKPPPYLPGSKPMMGWDGSTPVLYDSAGSGRVDLLREEFRRALHQNVQAGGISDYAKTNPFEAFAETFATMHHGPGDAIQTDQLRNFLSLVGNDSKKWEFKKPETTPLTPEGIAKVEALRASLGMGAYGKYHLLPGSVEAVGKLRAGARFRTDKYAHPDPSVIEPTPEVIASRNETYRHFLEGWSALEPGDGRLSEAMGLVNRAAKAREHWKPGGFLLHNDPLLEEIVKARGFDAKPTVVPEDQLRALVQGGAPDLWRGTDFSEAFRSGEYHAGKGVYGNGTYAAQNDPMEAARFGSGTLHMTLKPDAKVIDFLRLPQFEDEHDLDPTIAAGNAYLDGLLSAGRIGFEEHRDKSDALELLPRDNGRLAALLGYDAIRAVGAGGTDRDFYVILNRGAVVVSSGSLGGVTESYDKPYEYYAAQAKARRAAGG